VSCRASSDQTQPSARSYAEGGDASAAARRLLSAGRTTRAKSAAHYHSPGAERIVNRKTVNENINNNDNTDMPDNIDITLQV
jgi:hypothetical protein